MKAKNIASVLPAALLFFAFAGSPAAAEDFDARLASFSGTVDVQASGETDAWREAEAGMPLSAGDKVRTGADSSAEITLDGSGIIRLGESSEVTASSLKTSSSSFFLSMGSLVSKIKGLLKKEARLQVRTPTAVAAVRGTEFCVEHDAAANETTAGVFDEGRLDVSSLDADGKTVTEGIVEKGDEVSLRPGEREFKPGRMRRLLRRRTMLLAAREHMPTLHRNWRRMDPEKRGAMRKRFMARKAFQGARKKMRAARAQRAAAMPAGRGKAGAPGEQKNRAARRQALKNRRQDDGNGKQE